MADDSYKYKDLPRAANGIAPAKWNPDTGEFEVYTGVNDVKAVGVEDRLTAIENKLDSVISGGAVNTQVTGSNVEVLIVKGEQITPGSRTLIGRLNDPNMRDFNSYNLLARADSRHDYRLVIEFRSSVESYSNTFRLSVSHKSDDDLIIASEPSVMYSFICDIYLTNNGDSDHVYDVSVVLRGGL